MAPSSLIIAIVALVGSLVLLYPSAAVWFSDLAQASEVDNYRDTLTQLGPQARLDALANAQIYNDHLTANATEITPGERLPLNAGADITLDYDEQLRASSNGLMARIKIPAIDADLPIYHGTSEEVLTTGIGHLEGTALPVGGVGTHSVLTGHRGLATAELFTNLDRVVVDDTITIEVFGETLTYRVISTSVVEPSETQTLYPVTGEDLITLVTCTPLGVNSHRILVTAERILPTPPEDLRAAGEAPPAPPFPWWALGAIAALGAVSAYVWWSGRERVDQSPSSAASRTDGGEVASANEVNAAASGGR